MTRPSALGPASALLLLLAHLTQISTVHGRALQTPSPQQTTSLLSLEATPSPTRIIVGLAASISATSTSSSTAKFSNPPIYLHVSATAPDPLGISQVSGFYGPGAWSAWFLTIIAAWWRIVTVSKKKLDPNTWLFLLGANWASIDIFKGVHSLRAIPTTDPAYTDLFIQQMGTFAAAFLVVFWGVFHSVFQSLTTVVLFADSDCLIPRLRTLAVGLALPSLALCTSTYLLVPVIHRIAGDGLDSLPALYWHGMGSDTHTTVWTIAALTPALLLPSAIFWWMQSDSEEHILPLGVRRRFKATVKWLSDREIIAYVGSFYIMVSLLFIPVSIITCIVTDNGAWLFGMLPFYALFAPILIFTNPWSWTAFVPGSCVVYFFKGYLHLGSNVSESCFFMPCAPQSIREPDQLYALLAGLLSLVGFEVVAPAYNVLRKKFQERRLWAQQLVRQFEMRTPGGDGV